MRFSSITLISVLLFGIGFAAGGPFAAQALRHSGTPTGSDDDSISSSGNKASGGATGPATTSQPLASPAAMSSILQEANSYHRYRALTAYADSLRPEDIPGAAQKFEAGRGQDKEDTVDILIGKWVQNDPNGALAAARKKENRLLSDEIFQTVYGDWAARDSAGAIAQAKQLPEGEERDDALMSVAYAVTDRDPAQAQELLRDIRSCNFNYENHLIFSRWADQDLDQATQALFQPANFPVPSRRQEAVEGIADDLLEKDPRSAVAWLGQLPAGNVYNAALARVADQWAQSDPQAALSWIQTLPASSTRDDAIKKMSGQWADHDPRGAITYAATLPDGPQKTDLLDKSLTVWAQADAPSAWAWAQSLPSSNTRLHDLAAVISNWAQADPAAAARQLSSLPEEVKTKNVDMGGWFDGHSLFPGLSDKEKAYADVATNWAQTDPGPAASWLAQLPAGTSRDAAVRSFSDQEIDTHPNQALQSAESIGDDSTRRTEVEVLLRKWMQKDPASAAAAVLASSLPDDEKKRLMPK